MTSNDDGIIRPKSDFGDFVQTTRDEIKKVTWPERKETLMTTVMVVVLALFAGIFFLLVDSALGYMVSRFLGMNS